MTEKQIVSIAKKCHEANREYCESIGDKSQPTWKKAPKWQKDSAINGIKFHIENPDAGPSASHESWLKEKIEDGWEYGEVKNPEKKLHPCIVTYDELPEDQKKKDQIFIDTFKGALSTQVKTVTAPFIDGFDTLDTRPASCPIKNCEDLSCVEKSGALPTQEGSTEAGHPDPLTDRARCPIQNCEDLSCVGCSWNKPADKD